MFTSTDFTRRPSAKLAWEYRMIFFACFPITLLCEVVQRPFDLLTGRVGLFDPRKSILRSALDSAHSAATHAFQG